MNSQLSNVTKSSLKELKNYVKGLKLSCAIILLAVCSSLQITIGSTIEENNDLKKFASLLRTRLPPDPTMYVMQ